MRETHLFMGAKSYWYDFNLNKGGCFYEKTIIYRISSSSGYSL